MDAFYASVEQRDQPKLVGKPVIVGGDWGRGVVTAASYEARAYGVHSAMPGRRAAQLCPDAVFVRSRLDHYAAIGRQVREIFRSFTPVIQPLSLDEAFLDVSGVTRLHGSPEQIGRKIRQAIRDRLDLPASVGIAPLKFVAKIASDIDKPNGFKVVPDGEVQAFLDPLPVSRLWGVGKVGQQRLQRCGFHHVKDLRVASRERMQREFGAWGRHLWRLANGIDDRIVEVDHLAKGIGHERTFNEDLLDLESMMAVISYLCEQVTRRVRSAGRTSQLVTLKYRREDFKTFNRSKKLALPTDQTSEVFATAVAMLKQMRVDEPRGVRLLGVSLGKLSEIDAPSQLSLFGDIDDHPAQTQIDRLSDEITGKLGKSGIYRASSHDWIHRNTRKPDATKRSDDSAS